MILTGDTRSNKLDKISYIWFLYNFKKIKFKWNIKSIKYKKKEVKCIGMEKR